jgi:hypothetical protein
MPQTQNKNTRPLISPTVSPSSHEHIRLEPYIKRSMPFIIRKCATKRLMQFDIGKVKLRVSEEVPTLAGVPFPESLHELSSVELSNFLDGDNGWGGDLATSPARGLDQNT